MDKPCIIIFFFLILISSNLNAMDDENKSIKIGLKSFLCCSGPSREEKANHFYEKGLMEETTYRYGDTEYGKDCLRRATKYLGVSECLGHRGGSIQYKKLLHEHMSRTRKDIEEDNINYKIRRKKARISILEDISYILEIINEKNSPILSKITNLKGEIADLKKTKVHMIDYEYSQQKTDTRVKTEDKEKVVKEKSKEHFKKAAVDAFLEGIIIPILKNRSQAYLSN